MKKQRFFMLGIITVLVAVLSLTFVSSTFAKYTSTVSGSDSARVAKWEFEYNNADVTNAANSSVPQTITFDLFNTIKDSDGTSTETDVATDETLIAPGTSGSFEFVLENLSEVNAKYAIDYTIANTNSIPVQFRVKTDGGTFSEWSSSLTDVVATDIAMESGTTTITVEWQWVFNGNDVTDTTLGLAGTANIEVTATITFTQVD